MNHDFLSNFKLSRKVAFHLFVLAFLMYFILHSVYGNLGVIAYFKLNQKIEKAQEELSALRAERIEIEHRVKLLRPESLDKDMLDEQARNILGVAAPSEQVFTIAPEGKDQDSRKSSTEQNLNHENNSKPQGQNRKQQ